MKLFHYILIALFMPAFSACNEKEETLQEESTISIGGISLKMESRAENNGATSRATQSGFSVNTQADPSFQDLTKRTSWKLDFTLYYNGSIYSPGSFTEGIYKDNYWVKMDNGVLEDIRFPNYLKPLAELLLYPVAATADIATDQHTEELLFTQDMLVRDKSQIDALAHYTSFNLKHKHSMLDFVIKDIVTTDIKSVSVKVGAKEYTPYLVPASTTPATSLEYMLILPEGTNESPVVEIQTNQASSLEPITYRQTISIIGTGGNKVERLGSNTCYCFTLQGSKLEISPVTINNWTTGASLPGEYIVVTAYPTFRLSSKPSQNDYYLYFDNKLTKGNAPKLQKITFNENFECTVKPDGRIITHIGKSDSFIPTDNNKLSTPVILGKMIIDLDKAIKEAK